MFSNCLFQNYLQDTLLTADVKKEPVTNLDIDWLSVDNTLLTIIEKPEKPIPEPTSRRSRTFKASSISDSTEDSPRRSGRRSKPTPKGAEVALQKNQAKKENKSEQEV